MSSDCNARAPALRFFWLRMRPSRGSNLFSSSVIAEDMRQPKARLKCLPDERRNSAVSCVETSPQSLRRPSAETNRLPKKRCADNHLAAFLRRAEIRFILPSLPPSLLQPPHQPSSKKRGSDARGAAPSDGLHERASASAQSNAASASIRPLEALLSRAGPPPVLRRRRGTFRHASDRRGSSEYAIRESSVSRPRRRKQTSKCCPR